MPRLQYPECPLCLLRQQPFVFPEPRWFFWHQKGQQPILLDWPDGADIQEEERDERSYGEYEDMAHEIKPVSFRGYNRLKKSVQVREMTRRKEP